MNPPPVNPNIQLKNRKINSIFPEIYNENYRLTGRNPDYKPVCLKPEEHR